NERTTPMDAAEKMTVEKAKRIEDVLSFDAVFKRHAAGLISDETLFKVLTGMARVTFPNDPQAFSKYMKAHEAEMSDILRADYTQKQIEKGLGHPIPQVQDAAYHGATGRAHGVFPPAPGSAARDGMAGRSAADTVVDDYEDDLDKASDELVRMIKGGMKFDEAMKALRRKREDLSGFR